MAVHDIKDGETMLARHVTAEEWGKAPINFFSQDGDFMQVGMWVYDADKRILAHTHNDVPRTVTRTHETLYVRKGRIEVRIYNEARELAATLVAGEGDILTLMAGGHGYTILEDGTQVLEVKNGPYVGADRDRIRIES
jgi:quercetin dioxygenase-like cupin family protein